MAQQAGAWILKSTNNFCICCTPDINPAAIGAACESKREVLARKWLGEGAIKQSWQARCYVVVHPTTESYLREVGTGGQNTLGSSLIRKDKQRVVSRRIDLRGNVPDLLHAALPHELTHVVLADAFVSEELPRWADEGMAMQADPPTKLAGHSRDLDSAIAGQTVFHISELFSKADYPTADGRNTFYGESASLVNYLVARRSPSDFVKFLQIAGQRGYDAGLNSVYGIEGVARLEHLWRSQFKLAAN